MCRGVRFPPSSQIFFMKKWNKNNWQGKSESKLDFTNKVLFYTLFLVLILMFFSILKNFL